MSRGQQDLGEELVTRPRPTSLQLLSVGVRLVPLAEKGGCGCDQSVEHRGGFRNLRGSEIRAVGVGASCARRGGRSVASPTSGLIAAAHHTPSRQRSTTVGSQGWASESVASGSACRLPPRRHLLLDSTRFPGQASPLHLLSPSMTAACGFLLSFEIVPIVLDRVETGVDPHHLAV